MELALVEVPTKHRFVRIKFIGDGIPGEITILNFRNLLKGTTWEGKF